MSTHEAFRFRSLVELQQRLDQTGLDLGVSQDLSALFESVRLGAVVLPNRLTVLPMEGCDGTADGAPGELTFRRYRRFAAGGAGLLWFEATAVVEEGRANPRQLWLRKGNVAAFTRLVEQAREAAREALGPEHRPFLVVQLTHSGRYSRPGRAPRPIIAHHSPFLDPIHQLRPDYPLITDDDLERLEDAYVAAARCAYQAGFDAVDIKACHRYLISELHASFTRPGRYGGTFENRTRFFRNVILKIKESVPEIQVTSRLNAFDAMPFPYGFGVSQEDPAKPDLKEPLELVRFLRSIGAPVVNITIGNPYYNPHVNRPYDIPVAGAEVPSESPLEGVNRFVQVVRSIQEASMGFPVVGGGYSWLRHFFPHVAAANIRKGWVSLVGVGRMAFAYPDFARDLKEKGRLDEHRVCVACSACTQIMRDGGRSGCVPRDAEVYEPIYREGRSQALDSIIQMAKTCRQCSDPTCVGHCPAQVNIPRFVEQIAAGRFREAYNTIKQANVLAATCGYVCPAETLCEAGCINRHYTAPVPIRHLQRWVSQKALEEGWSGESLNRQPGNGVKMAVLGGGPAGVAAALHLAAMGYEVTMFDRAESLPGGIARATIPEERLPVQVIQRELEQLLRSDDRVRLRFGFELSAERSLDAIRKEGYTAILIALGLGCSLTLKAAHQPKSGRWGALDLIREVRRGTRLSGRILVLGGGNTAIDAALWAQKAGASDVSIIYRRSFAEMPAWPHERDEAIRAGIHFLALTAPMDYELGERGEVTGLRVVRTALGAVDEDGRRRPEVLAGSEHVIPADWIIEALGQRIESGLFSALNGVAITDKGLIQVNPETLETTRSGVFAAGDIING
ncbi:MAG TPA: FAD-dependent oxidoreductase, partial [Verrucomicrobiota bacterium]|nr:FAD-dependent oxidoreductase [Verrucomicrobiota bacterium]